MTGIVVSAAAQSALSIRDVVDVLFGNKVIR